MTSIGASVSPESFFGYPFDDWSGPKHPLASLAASETCGLRFDGTVECFGTDGGPDHWSSYVPQDVIYESLTCGGLGCCGFGPDGELECFGDMDEPPAGEFVHVSVSAERVCATRSNGTAVCWNSWYYLLPADGENISTLD